MEMKNNLSFLVFFVLFLCSSLNSNLCFGGDTISANKSLSFGQTIVSSGGFFELGFFRPGNSSKYYIGIWYKNIALQTVVWVANREKPLDYGAANLTIIQGNLVLLDRFQGVVWSTHSAKSVTPNNSVIAVLHDDGNLILSDFSDSSTPLILWQSFDYPTDTFLPGAKLGYDKRTQKKQVLVSWKNLNDPTPGLFSLELDPKHNQIVIKWNRTKPYWASGSWNGQTFSSIPEMKLNNIYNYSYTDNENESYFTYSRYNTNSTITIRLTMNVLGQIMQLAWSNGYIDWNQFWAQPSEHCEVYAKCGAFGVCDNANASCNCLSGFKPRSDREWNSNEYSGGCVRDQKVQCNATSEDKDSFWMNSIMRLPASQETNITLGEASQCRSTCFTDCSCTAYTYDGSATCSIWTGNLFNLLQLNKNETGKTIFIKRGSPEAQTKAKKSMKLKAILSSITALMFLLIGSFSYIYCRRRMEKRADRRKGIQGEQISHWHKIEGEAKVLVNNKNDEVIDVPYFHLETILEATDNFSNANKLGQGGFGPVYKGIFPGGKEIAVKRLSSHSRQGIDEFKNEVTLIAKLQHRNLVRLLGYCINAKEQILLYEYMPNKSLDAFIFDGKLCKLLDWKNRYDIILGIARGLAYLHHDSRLRIIHRDLKTSNILLDEEMNPKISDFGLARIVEGKRTEATTNKVVGTYGYMSPEYASDGLFSSKSDVFSFGVVVLEIISGRKNTGFYQSEVLNLLGYAWRLWMEEMAIQLTEKSLLESCDRSEVIKCINVALLCVQEDSNDRPNMSDVTVMLVGESMSLPGPNRPAFLIRTHTSAPSKISNNQLTITAEGGR
ncbi:hypothetical protein RND71_009584 [Anisodus tanguticus]|uniref:Receptor-like serine/threonine-protein kinase n=1 Tax=Anisodus tanguticus TaxID=243964 RepID=A0AAE1SG39_9SOLA|nr:hypothetical protein RND71_009584 [Anisodus tanguticus]